MRNSYANRALLSLALLGGFILLAPGCIYSDVARGAPGFRYFEPPDPWDSWSVKIGQWQSRQRDELEDTGQPEPAGGLRDQYLLRRSTLRRGVAREVATWIQQEARLHYEADAGIDHWPTLVEVLGSDTEDCDGLELLVNQLLLDLGFPTGEVYRAVVHRPRDDQYHMVTFWFESPGDPWVIDPTGAMVLGMPHMSEVPDWVPLKLFTANDEYSVHGRRPAP